MSATRPFGPVDRFGMDPGEMSSGCAGRAGRCGGNSAPNVIPPARQAATAVAVRATFSSGSAAVRTSTAAALRLEFGKSLPYVVVVCRHADAAPLAPHDPVFVDQEGGALNAHVLAAVHVLFLPHTVFLADAGVLVRGQQIVQLIFRFELLMTADAV